MSLMLSLRGLYGGMNDSECSSVSRCCAIPVLASDHLCSSPVANGAPVPVCVTAAPVVSQPLAWQHVSSVHTITQVSAVMISVVVNIINSANLKCLVIIVIKIRIVNLEWLEVFSQRNVFKEAGGQYVMYQFGKNVPGQFWTFCWWRCKIFQNFYGV